MPIAERCQHQCEYVYFFSPFSHVNLHPIYVKTVYPMPSKHTHKTSRMYNKTGHNRAFTKNINHWKTSDHTKPMPD